MTRRFCDRCRQEMKVNGDSTTFMESKAEGDITAPFKVTVSVPRESDLCVECRRGIVTNGKPA